MKLKSYSIESRLSSSLWKSDAIVGHSEAASFPLIYLRRPKHIQDDVVWEKIVNSIKLSLPKNFEVK